MTVKILIAALLTFTASSAFADLSEDLESMGIYNVRPATVGSDKFLECLDRLQNHLATEVSGAASEEYLNKFIDHCQSASAAPTVRPAAAQMSADAAQSCHNKIANFINARPERGTVLTKQGYNQFMLVCVSGSTGA